METGLDPINSPVKDETAMNVLRLESRIAAVVDYLARLKAATSRIVTSLALLCTWTSLVAASCLNFI